MLLSLAQARGAGLYLGLMRHAQSFLALGLCVVLALTSQSQLLARGAAQPVGHVVLCTGTGPVTVAVDAEGQPVATPHICPDCLAGFAAVLVCSPCLGLWQASEGRITATTVVHHVVMRALPPSVARAPPVPV